MRLWEYQLDQGQLEGLFGYLALAGLEDQTGKLLSILLRDPTARMEIWMKGQERARLCLGRFTIGGRNDPRPVVELKAESSPLGWHMGDSSDWWYMCGKIPE